MAISKISVNDLTAVDLGLVHNKGAGGVDWIGGVDISNMSKKRYKQFSLRTDRAKGIHQNRRQSHG